ncbi:ParB family protein [Ectothiorhodospira variabilis]|uniref:ParB family protein n=1 Tax=Ectothiorhodospira variabilis TaxID=505694 RepID=UPI001EFB35E9|nr:ParB family protein [Ectothiorhodospira variabilis]MCG5495519.1 hypothetical protein [Ectothiorhodospira variabilis]MCG5505127.1 hypothetical protein [Ectothiorhodospira variabilis]MCG5508284.1 hypothetical protein [Ectothiorhodospira variabilis]
MSSRKLIPDVAGMLREGHFRGSTANESQVIMPPADPVTVSQMVLQIDQIKTYDRNPRQDINPRYEEIKDSIRAQGGLNNALEITRRPGAEHYMVRAGGNTRLQILKELHAETGDLCFAQVHCLFHPWKDDITVLTAHLIENELRGDMTLIDKALGVQSLRREMEKEGPLSRNEFIRRLSAHGYTLSKRHIIRFEYAAEVLYPLIPEALRSGMGRPQIDGLRNQCEAHRQYWVSAGQDGPAYDQMWADILSELDGPDFDVVMVRQELEARLAQTLGDPVTRIRLEVDATLSGKRLRGEPEEEVDSETSYTPVSSSDTPNSSDLQTDKQEPTHPEPEAPTSAQETVGVGEPLQDDPSTQSPSPEQAEERLDTSHGNTSGAETASPPSPETSLPAKTLTEQRRTNHDLAVKLADHHGLSGCVLPLDRGMGFLVDLPKSSLSGKNAEQTMQRLVWWTLVSLSEFFADDERAHYMINHGMTPEQYLADGPRSKEILGERPRIDVMGNQLFSSPDLTNEDFTDLIALMRSCRLVRRHALPDATGDHLWRDIGDDEYHDDME